MSFDTAYILWRAEFASFEANCFEAVCAFVRVHFDNWIDCYYGESHEALNGFRAWAFERYLPEGGAASGPAVAAISLGRSLAYRLAEGSSL